MASIPKAIGDFAVLPVQLPQLPSLPLPTPATHYFYVRRHAPKVRSDDDDRRLFLANVPVDSTPEHFRALFAGLVGPGRFESVSFEDEWRRRGRSGGDDADKEDEDSEDEDGNDDDSEDDEIDGEEDALPRDAVRLADLRLRKRKRDGGDADDRRSRLRASSGDLRRQAALPPTWPRRVRRSGSTAVAQFADAKSVDVVLKAVAKVHRTGVPPVWPSPAASPATSLGPPWLAAHNRMAYPSRAALRTSVDAFFELYNQQEAAAAALARRLRNVPDEDGFVTVTRASGGRMAPARQEEAVQARAKQLAKQERQRTDLTSFYRFQLRERKKEEQAELQRQFQEDRQRVDAMREKRGKFKPEA